MKGIFIKDWKGKGLLGIYSSEDITNLTKSNISESNIKYEIFTRQLWNYMSTKNRLLKEVYILVKDMNKIDNETGYSHIWSL